MSRRPRRDMWECIACKTHCTVRVWPLIIDGKKAHVPPQTCQYWNYKDTKPIWVMIGKNSEEGAFNESSLDLF